MSTTHVDNTVEGLLLAAEKGRWGEAYFVTDGEPVVFREFLTGLVATRGIEPPTRNVPGAIARPSPLWRRAPGGSCRSRGEPPITRFAVWDASLECTIDDSKARRELGYAPVVGIEEGLAAL